MVTNVTPSQIESSLVTKHWFIIVSWRVNSRVGVETSTIIQQGKVQRPTICRKTHAHSSWNSQGSVLAYYQERGITINKAHYSEMLTDRLKPAIRSKCWKLLSKGVVLLHDNNHPHISAHIAETLLKLKFVMAHPPYSPDLASSDYHSAHLVHSKRH
jgi:hypothetical protein